MSTQEIANRLVELCRIGQYDQAYDELFAPHAANVEPDYAQGQMPSVVGIEAIKKKGEQFNAMIREVHSSYVSEPVVAGNFFSLAMGIDFTGQDGSRVNMEEVCLYEVQNGKIVKEQFFY